MHCLADFAFLHQLLEASMAEVRAQAAEAATKLAELEGDLKETGPSRRDGENLDTIFCTTVSTVRIIEQ